mmetsp:Transcript_44529/g.82875  ORF Transcript_44529/g.82875 Transcript_44529/m.82875 type:complete len:1660 (+) Transcript_44529:127-5106(+)
MAHKLSQRWRHCWALGLLVAAQVALRCQASAPSEGSLCKDAGVFASAAMEAADDGEVVVSMLQMSAAAKLRAASNAGINLQGGAGLGCMVHLGCWAHKVPSLLDEAPKAHTLLSFGAAESQVTTESAHAPSQADCRSYIPGAMFLELDTLQTLHFSSSLHQKPCPFAWESPASLLQMGGSRISRDDKELPSLLQFPRGDASAVAAFVKRLGSMGPPKTIACCIVVLWAIWWSILLVNRIFAISRPMTSKAEKNSAFTTDETRLELAAWKQGLWSWLSISWATRWIRRFGSSRESDKVCAEDFGRLGHPDDDAEACFQRFNSFWEEAVLKDGLEKATLWPVLLRLVTYNALVRLAAVGVVMFALDFVAKVFIVDLSLSYITWREAQEVQPDLAMSAMVAIALFCGVPMVVMLCDICMNMIDGRRVTHVQQALSTAIYRKAQRLPVTSHKGGSSLKAAELDEKGTSLVNLVSYDVMVTTSGCTRTIVWIVLAIITFIVLMVIACCKLRAAVIGGVGILPILLLLALGIVMNIHLAKRRQNDSHKRLQLLQEVLQGIRLIKSYAWDRRVLKQLMEIRASEVKWLSLYWWDVGLFIFAMQSLAPVLIACTLASHIWIYRSIDANTIFICLQMLNNLRIITRMIGDHSQNLMQMSVSVARIERFLKQPEAPMLREDFFPTLKLTCSEAVDRNVVQIQGSFSWTSTDAAVISDVNIEVKAGELIGVVGDAGSGKTALLHAMLGELFPIQGASLSRPQKVSYCSQVPWIFEGTLRDNILFASEYDEERYRDVLDRAALLPDLELLPGRDSTMIGSRGIALSGGQKARVSLARAAYSQDTEVALLDDPFGSLDAPTAQAVLNKLMLSSDKRKRAQVIALQADSDHLAYFDRVLVLRRGRVVFDGCPQDAAANAVFQSLLSNRQRTALRHGSRAEPAASSEPVPPSPALTLREEKLSAQLVSTPAAASPLRDEEFQGRATWATVKFYCSVGGWRLLLGNMALFLLQTIMLQISFATLAQWANHGDFGNTGLGYKFLFRYAGLVFAGQFVFLPLWYCGLHFSLNVSKFMHDESIKAVLHAPLDTFFDRHPFGRILNRMSNDLLSIDNLLFIRFSCMVGMVWSFVVPLGYVHMVMPWYFALLAAPVYMGIVFVVLKYWRVMVRLRHLNAVMRSEVNAHYVDVCDQMVSVRAYQQEARAAYLHTLDQNRWATTNFAGSTSIRMWVNNTVSMLFAMEMTLVALVAVFVPGWLGPGTLGLCITNCYAIQSGLSYSIEACCGAQFEFIALHRVWELMTPNIPQERPAVLPEDDAITGFAVDVERQDLVPLEVTVNEATGCLQVVTQGSGQLLLEEGQDAAGGLLVKSSSALARLAPSCAELAKRSEQGTRFRLVVANGAVLDAGSLAEQLALPSGPRLHLEFKGDWLSGGAHVVIEDLCVGYGAAGNSPDILHGVNLEVLPGKKLGIVGASGCGKSTLLLALLRLLEPRGGKVLLNGVDTAKVGLWTLRSALGLVPQDPMLFSGTMRYNLDPFNEFSDEQIWSALRSVQLEHMVASLPLGFGHELREAGSNLSFGQRQLLCLARMVLRQPCLLLLDEATSAIEPATQEIVQRTVRSAFAGSTIIAVVHRLETITDFDCAAVLDRGHVLEKGPVESLLATQEGVLSKMLTTKTTS